MTKFYDDCKMTQETLDNINEEILDDCKGTYVVWVASLDKDGNTTSTGMVLAAFEYLDQAVQYAKNITLTDIINLLAAEDCDCEVTAAHSISVEVEKVVNDEEGCAMSIGEVYKKTIEVFE